MRDNLDRGYTDSSSWNIQSQEDSHIARNDFIQWRRMAYCRLASQVRLHRQARSIYRHRLDFIASLACYPTERQIYHYLLADHDVLLPFPHISYPPVILWMFHYLPGLLPLYAWLVGYGFAVWAWFVFRSGSFFAKAEEAYCNRYLDRSVTDPELKGKLQPRGRFGSKRPLVSSEFFDLVQKHNVELRTEPLLRMERCGIVSGSLDQDSASERHEERLLIIRRCNMGYRLRDARLGLDDTNARPWRQIAERPLGWRADNSMWYVSDNLRKGYVLSANSVEQGLRPLISLISSLSTGLTLYPHGLRSFVASNSKLRTYAA